MTRGAEGSTRATPAGRYGPRGLALRCALEGRSAGQSGASWRVCPYDGRARPYSQRSWLLGYVAGRRAAGLELPKVDVDHDAPWPGDAP